MGLVSSVMQVADCSLEPDCSDAFGYQSLQAGMQGVVSVAARIQIEADFKAGSGDSLEENGPFHTRFGAGQAHPEGDCVAADSAHFLLGVAPPLGDAFPLG